MNKLRLLSAVLVAVSAPLAQAAIEISYQIDGAGPITVCSDAGGFFVSCAVNPGPPLVIAGLNATSNSPGGATTSFGTSAVGVITNSTAADHFIDILVTAQGFATPITPPSVIFASHIGGTVVVGSLANSLSFQSCIKTGAVLPACPGTFDSAVGMPAVTSALLGGAFMDDQISIIAGGLTAPFQIGEKLHILLGAGSSINFSASTTLTPVPEPMSIGLLGGVLLLTGRLIRRKASRA